MVNKKQFKEKIKKASIGIAGLGGLGSNAAVSLARTGIGKLILVDFDKIEESNLSRQYYFIDQIGKKKTEALKDNIQKINPEVKIEIHDEKLKKGSMTNFFKNVDIVIEALDKAETKANFIEETLEKLPNTPIIAASGVAGCGNSDRIQTRNLGELYLVYDENAKSSDEEILTGPRVSLIANWQANIALELLIKKGGIN